VVWDGGFEPFGGDYADASSAGVFLRFPGQWENAAWSTYVPDDAYYNLHRWYEPQTGRYARVDPVNLGILENLGRPGELPIDAVDAYYLAMLRAGNPKFEHAYGYVAQNPLLFADPLGLFGPGALAAAGGACVAVDGPVPAGDVVGVPILIAAGVWAAGIAVVDWWDNADTDTCDECDKENRRICSRLLVMCLENPRQPPSNRRLFGPSKDCGACYRNCVKNEGAWPFDKCPLP
jgi:RHS repeat-associated protein